MGQHRVEQSMLIDADAKKIWNELLDIHSWPQWKDFVKGTTFSGQNLALGSKFKMKLAVKGPAVNVSAKITGFDEAKALTWKGGVQGLVTAEHGFTLEPKPSATGSKTNVVSWEQFNGSLIGLVLKIIKPNDLESLHHKWLVAIKQRVEKL